jgi:hypothetical protein
MQRHLVTMLVLLSALGCYSFGFSTGAFGLLAVGGAFELWFWVRLLRGKHACAARRA